MKTIYLDNAATSFPKPSGVGARMREYVDSVGASVNRSSYGAAQEAEGVTLSLRRRLCRLFSFDDPARVILTPGCTFALNLALRGFLQPGDHCLVSSMEHNAVMRPLNALAAQGVAFDRIPCDPATGRLDPADIAPLLRPNTTMLVLAHASNVSGAVQDAAAVGRVCREHGIAFVLDAAQSAGEVPLDFGEVGASAVAVPGHKGLMGPSGVGALLLGPDFARQLRPIVAGGTGSASDSEEQPEWLPDRFEPGTPNVPGIYGLEAALSWLENTGAEKIAARERRLTARFLDGMEGLKGVRLVGPAGTENRVGVISADFPALDNAEAADRLEREFGILTRCGLHCAPAAHRTLGTFPRGTVRFSLGYFNTESDVDAALAAVEIIGRA
jgi:cysteine desulfurase family protein